MKHPFIRDAYCLLFLSYMAAATAPSMRAVPDAGSQASMEKLVHELYARQYADTAAASRGKLADMLLDQAAKTRNDPTARFVLMKEAADLACQANDADTAIRAIDQLAADFDVSPFDLKMTALRHIARTLSTPRQARQAVEQCLDLADQAMLNQDADAAESLLGLAHSAANKSDQVDAALKVRDRRKELTAFRQEQAAVKEAQSKLEAGQASAADRQCIGKMRCFVLNDWSTGLPLLADGDDLQLKKCARDELAADPTDALTCMAVANGWWDAAARQTRLQMQQILRHAAQWYRTARPGLSGVNMEIAETRLSQVPLRANEAASLQPGLATEIYSGQNFEHLLLRRVDAQINFNWESGPIGPTLPRDDFSLRWRGYLLAHQAGNFTFIMLANSGGRLMIDGKLLIDSDKLSHKRNGASMQMKLSAGAHTFRAEAWDGGGTAKAIVQWIVPGETQPAPIPPEAFRRE